MQLRFGRYGQYLACTSCKATRDPGSPTSAGEEAPSCPECNAPMVLKRSRFGPFWACSRYPACKGTRKIVTGRTSPNTPTGVKCPDCGEGEVIEKRSKRGKPFWGCNRYPKCTFTLNAKPVPHPCPSCGAPFLLEKKSVKKGVRFECRAEGCEYRAAGEEKG